MKFYITHAFTGGNVNIIEQAANECGVQLLSVDECAVEDISVKDREYISGDVDYIFLVDSEKTGVENKEDAMYRVRLDVISRILAIAHERSGHMDQQQGE